MKRLMAGLVLFVSVILLSVSLYYLAGYLAQEKKSSDTYEEIRTIYEDPEEKDGADSEQDDAISESENEAEVDAGLLKLHEENPDCIGWIHIEGTAIDYPVMYHPAEKEYYLHRNFYQEYDYSGTPYLSEICDPAESDNLIIYGHHMNSGTMFADLEKFKSEDFWKEHQIIEYRTLQGNETYQILAAFAVPVYTGSDFQYYSFSKAASVAEYAAFIAECKTKAYYDTGVNAFYGDKLITLSTCEYSHKNGRMVVVGKRIE